MSRRESEKLRKENIRHPDTIGACKLLSHTQFVASPPFFMSDPRLGLGSPAGTLKRKSVDARKIRRKRSHSRDSQGSLGSQGRPVPSRNPQRLALNSSPGSPGVWVTPWSCPSQSWAKVHSGRAQSPSPCSFQMRYERRIPVGAGQSSRVSAGFPTLSAHR